MRRISCETFLRRDCRLIVHQLRSLRLVECGVDVTLREAVDDAFGAGASWARVGPALGSRGRLRASGSPADVCGLRCGRSGPKRRGLHRAECLGVIV